jgi:hypothetical protein
VEKNEAGEADCDDDDRKRMSEVSGLKGGHRESGVRAVVVVDRRAKPH